MTAPRRLFLTRLLICIALAGPVAGEAQPAGKSIRIGILCVGICPVLPLDVAPDGKALLDGLRELGYVDGKNLAIEVRGVGATYETLPALSAELVRRNADVIIALGSPASVQAAKNATSTVPIVMVGVPDVVELGLLTSLARPGGTSRG